MNARPHIGRLARAVVLSSALTSPHAFAQEDGPSRVPLTGETPPVRFNEDATAASMIPFIMEATGKIVIPTDMELLERTSIALVSDPIDRNELLDLIFRVFRINGIGVIERDDLIILGDPDRLREMPDKSVLGPNDDVLSRTDNSNIVIKVFSLTAASAASVGRQLEEQLPTGATISVSETSNQIVVRGEIELCKRFQQIIDMLDRRFNPAKTQTFILEHADAGQVEVNIQDLFEGVSLSPGGGGGGGRVDPSGTRGRSAPRPAPGANTTQIGLRYTVDPIQNAVTVIGEPEIVDEIAKLVADVWDKPRPVGTTKVYVLEHSDPTYVKQSLENILNLDSSGAGGANRARRSPQGGGGGAVGVDAIVTGVYKIEAMPDINALVVISRTSGNFEFLDNLIAEIDRPCTLGVPVLVPLMHSSAVDVARELNVLLSEGGGSLELPARGLNHGGIEGFDSGGEANNESSEAIEFPWQEGATDDRSYGQPSGLIGRVRIVPVVRRNALAILAPPAHRDAVIDLVSAFDKPGRQVRIRAVLAEVELNDDLMYGLRASSGEISSRLTDNLFGAGIEAGGEIDNILSGIFDSGTLSAGTNVNVALQALSNLTTLRVIQQPMIFTADNQEAVFFDGQQVPFNTGSQTTSTGIVSDGISREPVGVFLNVRPRITADRDVDMEVRLQLSTLVPGPGQVVDRRETSTNVVVKNDQTIIISGLLRTQDSTVTRKVPLLGDIPLLGEIFTSRENTTATTELVAFITPTVVDEPDENDANFNDDARERLRQLIEELSVDDDLEKSKRRIGELIMQAEGR